MRAMPRPAWWCSRPLLVLCLLAALLSFVGLRHELWTPDEPRVAAIGRAMWRSGDLAVPRLNGRPFLEKPPLYWWSEAAVFAVAGRATAPLARLPSALFGFGSALLTYALARRYFRPVVGLAAGLVFLTFADHALHAHWVIVDNALTFGVVGALTAFAYAEEARGPTRGLLLGAMYGALTVACLSKGLVGLGIPVLGIGVYLLWTGRWRRFLGPHLLLGGLAVALVAGAWLWRLDVGGGWPALEEFLLRNQVGRFIPGAVSYNVGHHQPPWYYLQNAPAIWLPWTPLLVVAAIWVRRTWSALEPAPRRGLQLAISASLPTFAVLSVAGTKRGLYLDPILPAVALLIAAWMVEERVAPGWELRVDRALRAALWGLALAIAAACVAAIFVRGAPWATLVPAALLAAFAIWVRRGGALSRPARWSAAAMAFCLGATAFFMAASPVLDAYKSFRPFVSSLEATVPAKAPLYAFEPDETLYGVIDFYTGRRATAVGVDELRRLAHEPRESFVVIRDHYPEGSRTRALRAAGIPYRVVAEQVMGGDRAVRILAVGAGEEGGKG